MVVFVAELVVVVSFILPTTVRTVSSFFPPLNDVCQPNYFCDDQETQPPSLVCCDRTTQNKRNTMDGIVVVVVTGYIYRECICSSRAESQLKIFSHFSAAEGCHLEARQCLEPGANLLISTAMTAIPVVSC